MENKKTIQHAVILMAGRGTRFLPATKAVAKEMFAIGNVPAILYLLKECLDSGIRDVTIVLSKEKKDVKKFFKRNKKLEKIIKGTSKQQLLNDWWNVYNNIKLHFVYQSKKINGTAGAVYSARRFVKNKPFALLFGDDLYISNNKPALKELIDAYYITNNYVLGCVEVCEDVVGRYGVAVVCGKKSGFDLVKGFKEKPKKGEEPSRLASLGRYILLPNIFNNILKAKKHEQGEKYLPEAIALECKKNNVVACKISANYYDLGNKLEFIKCTIDQGLKDDSIREKLKEYLEDINKQKK